MFDPLVAMLVFLLYVGALFLVALWAERRAAGGRSPVNNPWIYGLSLAVYCTAWTYYGSVGMAASSGLLFLAVYLGPSLGIILWWKVLRRMTQIKSRHHITSIADFISARYDKSEALAALATVLALCAIIPYVSLQLKAIITTFDLITTPGRNLSAWIGGYLGPMVVIMMVLFSIVIGVRRVDPTERHDGMVMALAVECGVKLASLLVAGVFVTYFLYDGFGDLFQRLAQSPHHRLFALSGETSSPYLLWATYIVLAASASLFLPRQFHVAVVENPNPDFVSTAMWLFPAYMLLINLFVLPIAAGGLLQGLPAAGADTFVLDLPRRHGQPWLVMLVFIGGFSAATGMIMISSVTLSTMLTNHLLMPLVRWVPRLGFLRRHLLHCKWAAVALVLALGYGFDLLIGQTFMLANIGMISFAAVFQFAPIIVGGMFWRQANKWGALAGLSAGFGVWLYCLLLPALIRVGWFSHSILETGPWGLGALNPERLFGLNGFAPLAHTLFWSIVFNMGAFVLVSIWQNQSPSEKRLAAAFGDDGWAGPLVPATARHSATIDPRAKCLEIEKVLHRYLVETDTRSILARTMAVCRLEGKPRISIVDLINWHSEVEKSLAGAIGAPAAHKALSGATIFTPEESLELSEVYKEVLTSLRIAPEELYAKLDYYREKESLLTSHAAELREYSKALELRILEQEKAEAALKEVYRTMEQRVADRTGELQAANRELLTAKEAAEAATRAKSEFLATMSHEIRTPLNGVIAAAELALNESMDAKTAHFLKIIHTSAISLLGIINDILDFSKIEAGKLDLETGPFNLETVLDGVTGLFVNKVTEKELELIVAIHPQTRSDLVGDAPRLQQVLKNLLDNAIKFTEKGGVIELGAAPSESAPELLQFQVRDTGVGIDPEYRRILFDPFTQADASITRKHGGTGLGLCISKQLVEIMGGAIEVESTPGIGTTFRFTARFEPCRTATLPLGAGTPAVPAGLRLLLVDDCPPIVRALTMTMTAWGMQVVSAASVVEAVERLRAAADEDAPFDLVVLDQKMASMDGLTTARQIRAENDFPVPLLLLTPFDRSIDRSQALAAGVSGCVAKPVYPTPLLNAILSICSKPSPGEGPGLSGPLLKPIHQGSDQRLPWPASRPRPIAAQASEPLGQPSDPAVLRPLIVALNNALDMADPQEIRYTLNAIRAHLDPDIWHALDDCIGDYDYDRALTSLRNAALALGLD